MSLKLECLLRASASGDTASVTTTLDEISLRTTSRICELALQSAAENGHVDVISVFVTRGVDFRANGNWALRVAAKNGHIDVVRFLIEKGADPWDAGSFTFPVKLESCLSTVTTGGSYPFLLAAEQGHLQILQLLESSIPLERVNELWLDALCKASELGFTNIIKYVTDKCLRDSSGNLLICSRENYALRFSSLKGNFEAVQILVEAGANIKDRNSQSIRWAADKGKTVESRI